MDKKLKVGLVGLGGIATYSHMPAYLNMDNVEVAAICDILPEKITAFKKRFALADDIPSFTDYNDLIKFEGLDFVDICTPNLFHSKISVAAMENGLHVFSEKPDAVSVEEVMKMKEASEKYNKRLMVMRNNRYRPTSKYLKQYIADGKMGDIYCGRCGWIRRRGIPGKGGWFTTKELSGGGPLIDLGVHMIDLAIWLMGNPVPVAVSGCTYRKFADSNVSNSEHAKFGSAKDDGIFDVEDLAMGFIKFDNGACLQIEFSWASNIEREKRFVELRGTKAGFTWNDDGTCGIWTEDKKGKLVDLHPDCGDMGNGHARALEHFTKSVLDGAEKDYVPEQGVNMIKILDAIYKSAETGREVLL